jgi:aldehyde dehydrogenase (NAD+)
MTTTSLFHLINGREMKGPATSEDRSPADPNDLVALVPTASNDHLAEAAEAARTALPRWARMSGPSRAEILYRAAELIDARAEVIATDLTREMGKPIGEALGETRRAASILRYWAGQTYEPVGEVFDSISATTRISTLRQPVGVVCVITPWNFPIAIPAWKIGPALAYGNTVVFKPATATPRTADHLVRALLDAGLPPGVLNLVYAAGEQVSVEWIRHARVDAVSFTGSEAVGRALQVDATRARLRVQLELGGKNAVVVADDGDLELAAGLIVRGAMASAGQKCTATSRVIASHAIVEPLTDAIIEGVAALTVGDPLDAHSNVGPVIDEAARVRITSMIDLAVAGGGRAAAPSPLPGRGFYVAPTVVADIRDSRSPIATQEVFGPVVAILTADTLGDAIRLHNGVAYGLSGSIVTKSLATAQAFIAAAQVGVVHVNGETAGAEPHVPFGGMKGSSSFSREQGRAAADFYTQTKTVYLEGLTETGLFDLS